MENGKYTRKLCSDGRGKINGKALTQFFYFSGIKNIFYQFVTIPIIPTPGVIIV